MNQSPIALLPHVIYPYGDLLDLLPMNRERHSGRVYGVEFTSGIVKVGHSGNCSLRLPVIVKQGAALGLQPIRFFVSPQYKNALRIEGLILGQLRAELHNAATPEDFPGATEWFANCPLERPLELTRDWEPWLDEYGFQIGVRSADVKAKKQAETAAGVR